MFVLTKNSALLMPYYSVLLIIFKIYSVIGVKADTSTLSPVINTSLGYVQGLQITSAAANNFSYFSFKGIPYALPPVGDLRFKAPQPPNKWNGVLKAFVEGPACWKPFATTAYRQYLSEDCLTLNVYIPYYVFKKNNSLLPVMVWIHGGGFSLGSGNSKKYGPDFLVSEGIVVVTINYRLGIFGFLNEGISDAPGNVGLKDQLMALRWIKNEIHRFGGNPHMVTISGQSAGGASVHFHLLSPLSKGLFHRAIIQSGTILSEWAFDESDHYDKGSRLSKHLGCPETDNKTTIVACLRTFNASFLADKQMTLVNYSDPLNDYINGTQLAFYPTLEDKIPGEEQFVTKLPKDSVDSDYLNSIPIVIGNVKDEGIVALAGGLKKLKMIDKYLEYFVPKQVRRVSTQDYINELTNKLRGFYFAGKPVSNENVQGSIDLNTDKHFAYGTSVVARALLQKSLIVYMYIFGYNGHFKNYMPSSSELNITDGVNHVEELGYLFHNENFKQNLSDQTEDILTLKRMVRMWANFVKYGDPTPDTNDEQLSVKWHPATRFSTQHLFIDRNISMTERGFLADRMTFWDTISAVPDNASGGLPTNKLLPFIALLLLMFSHY